ncbi:hypothetical protein AHAS_Ahas08G0057500 [Arachis hypogaea]
MSGCTMGKTVIKKSGTRENPDRLFHACPRYRKGSHCNYFRWVEDDDYEGLENLGEVKTDAQMESDAALLNHNISWRMMTLEAEVKALRMQLYFGLIVVIVVFMIMCLKPEVGTNVMKLASFLAVAELLPLMVSADTATAPGEAFPFALALVQAVVVEQLQAAIASSLLSPEHRLAFSCCKFSCCGPPLHMGPSSLSFLLFVVGLPDLGLIGGGTGAGEPPTLLNWSKFSLITQKLQSIVRHAFHNHSSYLLCQTQNRLTSVMLRLCIEGFTSVVANVVDLWPFTEMGFGPSFLRPLG